MRFQNDRYPTRGGAIGTYRQRTEAPERTCSTYSTVPIACRTEGNTPRHKYCPRCIASHRSKAPTCDRTQSALAVAVPAVVESGAGELLARRVPHRALLRLQAEASSVQTREREACRRTRLASRHADKAARPLGHQRTRTEDLLPRRTIGRACSAARTTSRATTRARALGRSPTPHMRFVGRLRFDICDRSRGRLIPSRGNRPQKQRVRWWRFSASQLTKPRPGVVAHRRKERSSTHHGCVPPGELFPTHGPTIVRAGQLI